MAKTNIRNKVIGFRVLAGIEKQKWRRKESLRKGRNAYRRRKERGRNGGSASRPAGSSFYWQDISQTGRLCVSIKHHNPFEKFSLSPNSLYFHKKSIFSLSSDFTSQCSLQLLLSYYTTQGKNDTYGTYFRNCLYINLFQSNIIRGRGKHNPANPLSISILTD